MSNLKEEWSNLMKLRGSGSSDQQISSLRSRIFNNFVTPSKIKKSTLDQIDEIPTASSSNISKTFFDKSLHIFNRTRTPEPQKSFGFGLNIIKPDPEKSKLPVRSQKTDEVWKIDDYPYKEQSDEHLPDRFEVLSIASFTLPSKLANPDQSICIFSDLSPVSRQLCNLTFEEEQRFLKESKKHENFNHGLIHLLHQNANFQMIDKITWTIARDLSMGFLFKSDFLYLLDPNALNFNESEEKEKVEEFFTEKTSPILKKKTFEAGENAEDNISELEKEMIEMLESLNSMGPVESSDDKINALLGIVEKKIKGNKEVAGNMQLRILYQFLLEYKKAKEGRSVKNSLNETGYNASSKKISPEKGVKFQNTNKRGRVVKGHK